jgi:hypothetical protein
MLVMTSCLRKVTPEGVMLSHSATELRRNTHDAGTPSDMAEFEVGQDGYEDGNSKGCVATVCKMALGDMWPSVGFSVQT